MYIFNKGLLHKDNSHIDFKIVENMLGALPDTTTNYQAPTQ